MYVLPDRIPRVTPAAANLHSESPQSLNIIIYGLALYADPVRFHRPNNILHRYRMFPVSLLLKKFHKI